MKPAYAQAALLAGINEHNAAIKVERKLGNITHRDGMGNIFTLHVWHCKTKNTLRYLLASGNGTPHATDSFYKGLPTKGKHSLAQIAACNTYKNYPAARMTINRSK